MCRITASIVAVVVGCLVAFAVAQEQPKKPAAKPPVRVIVTLKDGTKAAGVLAEAGPKGLTVEDAKTKTPREIAWAEVDKVSSGLTREKAVAEFKAAHADRLCETCKGDGTADHEACKGSGVDPAQAVKCATCDGGGSIGPCKTKGCVEGKVACPAPCLKAERFTGKPDAEGKRWLTMRVKGGTVRVSDAHVGELLKDNAEGVPAPAGKCPTCGGTIRVADAACAGTGKQPCKACSGHGVTGPGCADCDAGHVPCATCAGGGLRPA